MLLLTQVITMDKAFERRIWILQLVETTYADKYANKMFEIACKLIWLKNKDKAIAHMFHHNSWIRLILF